MNPHRKAAGPQDVPDKLQKNVRAFLLAHPKGAPLAKFCRDYRQLVKEFFPWKSLGTYVLILYVYPLDVQIYYTCYL